MEPLISVIVPVYNVEALLPRCVDSLLAQTYSNLEIILVDDGSGDNCGAICDDYARKDGRVRVIHQANAGVASARNAGLAAARGEYLGFVDGDDRVAPEMYETLLDCLRRAQADVAVCGRYMELASGELIPLFTAETEQILDKREAVRRFLLSEGLDAASWDKLCRRDFFGNMQYPTQYISEDVPVTARLLARAGRVVHCGKPLYYYYQRPGSRSREVFARRSLGLYHYFQEIGREMEQRFPDLREEAQFFRHKALLVLLFRYADSRSNDPIGKELYGCLRRDLASMCRNRYLGRKYKIFALGACCGLDRLAVRLSNRFKINDNSLTQ